MRERGNKGFTLMEVLIVVAIIGVLASVAIPILSDKYGHARESVDLSNMRTAYSLARVEYMGELSDNVGPYYFNGTDLQYDATGIVGYGQSSTSASEFAKDFPVQVTGTPNPTGNPEDARYLIIFCDDNGVSRVSWGSGAYGGKQSVTQSEHEAVAADHDSALNKDVELLNSLENALRTMSAKEIRDLIAKYNITISWMGSNSCIQIAKCNVKETHEVDDPKTEIYVPEIFEAIGYDTSAEQLYILESRDAYKNGDIIWVNLGTNINTASDDALMGKAFTYVKSNGDSTDGPLKYDNRKNLNKR